MADVITPTSLMSDVDRHAMAVYLKSQEASPSVTSAPPDPGTMRRGAAIYRAARILPPGKRRGPTKILSAPRTQCHAAAG